MGFIIWCCTAIVLFMWLFAYGVRMTVEGGPVIGYWPGIFCCCLPLAFIGIWTARLILAIRDRRHHNQIRGIGWRKGR